MPNLQQQQQQQQLSFSFSLPRSLELQFGNNLFLWLLVDIEKDGIVDSLAKHSHNDKPHKQCILQLTKWKPKLIGSYFWSIKIILIDVHCIWVVEHCDCWCLSSTYLSLYLAFFHCSFTRNRFAIDFYFCKEMEEKSIFTEIE